jgi:hypothetical protein
MTTASHQLRDTIEASLSAAHPRPVPLAELYRAVEQAVEFDADDLASPTVRGSPVSEPSWRRNVRNVLQHSKRAGTLVNVQYSTWGLPTPNPKLLLDESAAWPEIRRAAENALEHDLEFRSTQQGHRYRILEVGASRISIRRLDSQANETLSESEVTLGIRYLNAAGGRLGRRTMHYTVAKEVAMVSLHPRLAWSADSDWIEVLGVDPTGSGKTFYRDFGEAPDDDPARLARFARRVRAGQPRFRRNLIRLYGECCAISGWRPESVLEAAHILLHAESGVNHSDNGILLRSDLHNLFDEGLLRIDPDSLLVVLHPVLAGTPYWELNGTALRPRIDESHPDREYLRRRWNAQSSADKVGDYR